MFYIRKFIDYLKYIEYILIRKRSGFKRMDKTKKLYHISLNFIEPDNKSFIARIPYSTAEYENDTIKRICFSDSIEGCLNLVNWTENLLIKKIILENNKSCPIRVYEFEFDTNDEDLLTPNDIFKYVPDANLFNEYWYIGNKEIYPTKSYCIEIQDNFDIGEITLDDGITKYIYRNIKYDICEIIKPIIKDKWQIFNFDLKISESNDEKDLDTIEFMIKFNLLRMQPQLFEAIHLGEFGIENRYTIKSEIIKNNKLQINIKSPFFALSKKRVLDELSKYIIL